MIILLDLGNSRIKIGWIKEKNGVVFREQNILTFQNNDYKSIRTWLCNLSIRPKYAFGSNVAGNIIGEKIFNEFKSIGCPIVWITPKYKTSKLINKYYNYKLLGSDRWAIMLGIVEKQEANHPPLLIVSFGTATTIDTINSKNHFIGGFILPGIKTMKLSLAKKTANLFIASKSRFVDFPRNTNQAISSGIIASHSGIILRQWLAILNKYNSVPILYVTGGLWPEVKEEVTNQLENISFILNKKSRIIYLERAVLDGLATIANKNNILNNIT